MTNKSFWSVMLLLMLTAPLRAEVIGEEVVADTSRVYDIEEVVVVSQPKEFFRLRQQPVSSTSFSNAQIGALHVKDLREISDFVPSFTMPNYGSRYTSSMYIRGIGSRVNSPAVGIYLDGMPLQSKSAFNSHIYDIDRVDILRGAQGTLYGMNTEGGLVRIYTKNPMRYQGTDVTLSAATHWGRRAEVSHYHKVGEKFAFSLAGFYNGQKGFFRNAATGDRADAFNEAGGRLRLVWQPTKKLDFDYVTDYQYVRQNGFPYGMLTSLTGTAEEPNANHQSGYRRNMLNTGLNVTYHANGFDLNSITTYQYLRDYMLMDIDYLPQDYMHMEQRQKQSSLTQELTLKSRNSSAWHWTFGGFFSYQSLTTNAPVYFGSSMNEMLSQNITNYAYYGMYNAMVNRMVGQGMPKEAAERQVAAMIERAGGCTIDMQLETIPGSFKTPQLNLGFFHESNIDLSDRLTATLGLRYDFSRADIDYRTSARTVLSEDVMGQHVDAAVSSILHDKLHNTFDQFLPKLGLRLRIDEKGSNIFATVSKGYRAGGYNIQMFSDILQTELQSKAQTARGKLNIEHDAAAYDNIAETIAFEPETSWNYELGTHLNLFDNRVQFDLSGYYMRVSNQQLSVMAGNYGFGRVMVNAGRSYSCGVETSLRGSALENRLTWAVNYAFTHAVFKEYDDSIKVGGKNQHVSYKDKKVPFVPQYTAAASVDYRLDFKSQTLRSLTFGVNGSAQGKTWWDEANTYSQKFYFTAGAHVDAAFPNVVVSLWGRNLTNTKYNTFAVQSAATGERLTFAQRGMPLQLGVDVKLKF
ncbi:MAG: TonB-dependent receptor [Prevotella sp.]|nr:TonB-dependent receptor [Prevotella sp.]